MTALSHTIGVSRTSPPIRAFCWLYDDPKDLNTCKLFWGFLFFLPILALRLIFMPIIRAIDALTDKRRIAERRRAARAGVRPTSPPPEPVEERPSRFGSLLTVISNFMSVVWFKVAKPVTWALRILFALVVVAAIVALIFLIVAHMDVFLKILIAFGVAIAFIGFLLGAMYLFFDVLDAGKGLRRFGDLIVTCFHHVHDHTCANVRLED